MSMEPWWWQLQPGDFKFTRAVSGQAATLGIQLTMLCWLWDMVLMLTQERIIGSSRWAFELLTNMVKLKQAL